MTSTTPFWKKIYQTVSGYSKNITDSAVADALKECKNELLQGLLLYKNYTKKGYTEWCEKSEVSNEMKEFIHDLSVDLDLDAGMSYAIMCNYLMYEFYGKIKEFWQLTRIGTTVQLRESIWNFFTSERMFLLKTWKQLFEFVDRDHVFAEQYHLFLKTLKLSDLHEKLINQYEGLLEELSSDSFHAKNYYIEMLLSRNAREQIELVSVLLLAMKRQALNDNHMSNLVNLFIRNNFSTRPPLYDLQHLSNQRDLEELMFIEIGCFLVILDNFWTKNVTTFWSNEYTREMDDLILSIHLNPGQTLVLFIWLILRFKCQSDQSDARKIMEILEKEPFVILHSMINDEIFQNCYLGQCVIKSTHKMLDELCLMFKDRNALYSRKKIMALIARFLKIPSLVTLCLADRNGLDEFVRMAAETFPLDFMSLTLVAESLLGERSQYKTIMHLLNNMPSFLSDATWTSQQDEISILKSPQAAFADSELIMFPANTGVRSYSVFGKNYIQYIRTDYSYFIHLEYLIDVLVNTSKNAKKFDDDLVEKIMAGFRVVLAGIKYCLDMDLTVVGIHRIVMKFNKLLIHLEGPLMHFGLMELYYEILNALIIYRKSTFFDIVPDHICRQFFPRIHNDHMTTPVEKMLFSQYIFDNNIFMKLFYEEEFRDNHSLLITYFDLLQNILKLENCPSEFQIAGVAYIFNYVFLQHQGWHYKSDTYKTRITLGCLNIFHYILQKPRHELDEYGLKMFTLTQHAFLNNSYIIESFFRLFITQKYHFLYVMERETNWYRGPANIRIKCIRMQLALLLVVMNEGKNFEKTIFQDRLPFIVKPVTSYFTNSYSPIITELSCRFLDKLAQDSKIPLLALLEFDHYQVQSLFLERLKDTIEEDCVKIAIIDLINTCIACQNGMTAAFFNLKCFMYWDGVEDAEFKGTSVSDFMVDYLQNVKKSNFKNPLQLSILKLLLNLWINHRDNLIENVEKLDDFWPIIAEPLMGDYEYTLEVYSVTLRLLNEEMGTCCAGSTLDPKFVKTIEEFFKDKVKFRKWINFVLTKSAGVGDDAIAILVAWSEFLVMTKKTLKEVIDDDIKIILLNLCLEGLKWKEGGFNNIEVVYLWAQLYFLLMSDWHVIENQKKSLLMKYTKFMISLTVYYKYLDPKIKEMILCGLNRTILDLQSYLVSNTTGLITLLYPLGSIIEQENEYLEKSVWNKGKESDIMLQVKPWLVLLSIGNTLIGFDCLREITLWFDYSKMLEKVLNSIGPLVQNRSTLPFGKLGMDFLITYAESPLVTHFLKIDLFVFYFKLRPPSLTISINESLKNGVPIQLKEWWLLFITIMKFNRVLLSRLGHRIINNCFTFVLQYEKLLKEVVSLVQNTVDMMALTLVCESLKYIYLLIQLIPQWSASSPKTYTAIMNGIKCGLNASALTILGYKKINFYEIIFGKRLQLLKTPPAELLLSVLNKVMEITYWASTCLRKTKPDVMIKLDMPEIQERVIVWIENDFSVPRFELPLPEKLTYGTLLCFADYLCKTLYQLSPQTPSRMPRNRQVSMTDIRDEMKGKSLAQIFEHCTAKYEMYIGFLIYLSKSDDMTNEKLTSFLHYDMSEFTHTSVVNQMDYQLAKNGLEALMTFLSCEIFYTLRYLREDSLFSFKRELNSEIQFFYEFVRKRTGELLNAMVIMPRSSQSDSDITTRYVMRKVSDNCANDIADMNFVVVISQWLNKFLHLSN